MTDSSTPQNPRLNIVIGVQDSFAELTPQKQAARLQFFEQYWPGVRPALKEPQQAIDSRDMYRAEIKRSVELLRAQGIPTLWMAIGDDSILHTPAQRWSQGNSAVRPLALLQQAELTSMSPRADEAVLQKRFTNGFIDRDDVRSSPELERYILGQRRDGANYTAAQFSRPTLASYLKDMGTQHVSIMGGMTEHCAADNCMGAALRGMRVTVLSDLLADDEANWRKAPAHAQGEGKKLAATLDHMVADPASRGYKASEAPALAAARKNIGLQTSAEYLAKLQTTSNLDAKPAFNHISGKGRLAVLGAALTALAATLGYTQPSDEPDAVKVSPKTAPRNTQLPQP